MATKIPAGCPCIPEVARVACNPQAIAAAELHWGRSAFDPHAPQIPACCRGTIACAAEIQAGAQSLPAPASPRQTAGLGRPWSALLRSVVLPKEGESHRRRNHPLRSTAVSYTHLRAHETGR